MHTETILLMGLLALVVCGDEKDEADQCSRFDVDGIYTVTFQELSGNCGPVGPLVVPIDGGNETPDPGCVYTLHRWKDNDCIIETAETCEDSANNLRTIMTGTATQEEGGDSATGKATMNLTTLSGIQICISTYDIAYNRQ